MLFDNVSASLHLSCPEFSLSLGCRSTIGISNKVLEIFALSGKRMLNLLGVCGTLVPAHESGLGSGTSS